MGSPQEPMTIPGSDPRAIDILFTIREGDLAQLRRLVREHAGLARARVLGREGKPWRTPLHMVADWPGYFPDGPQAVRILVAAGADPDDRDSRPGAETPLHWAASTDDADVARALIEGGADVNAAGGSIGTPVENAVGYACWHVARLLAGHGAAINAPWVAAALGERARLEELLGADAGPQEVVSHAFWQACHAGQLRIAQYLHARGADPGYVPGYAGGQSAAAAATAPSTRRQALVTWLEGLSG